MKNSVTEAGPASTPQAAHIDAINQCFAVFRRNYHNQYFKAFPNEQELNISKRLWLDSLRRFCPSTITAATKNIIQRNEFLPTLATMVNQCESLENDGAPEAHNAYIEACNASSPKLSHSWSHPAVYFAGKKTDWHFLSSNEERIAFPIFKKNYETLLEQHRGGNRLELPQNKALPKEDITSASSEVRSAHLKNIKKLFN